MKRLIMLLFVLAAGAVFTGCDDTEDDAASKFNVLAERVNKDNAEAVNVIVMVEASSDVEWTASVPEADRDWLTLEKDSGTGIGRIIFSLSENGEIDSRSTSISVTGRSTRSGREFSAPAVVVTQLGAAPSILIEPHGYGQSSVGCRRGLHDRSDGQSRMAGRGGDRLWCSGMGFRRQSGRILRRFGAGCVLDS